MVNICQKSLEYLQSQLFLFYALLAKDIEFQYKDIFALTKTLVSKSHPDNIQLTVTNRSEFKKISHTSCFIIYPGYCKGNIKISFHYLSLSFCSDLNYNLYQFQIQIIPITFCSQYNVSEFSAVLSKHGCRVVYDSAELPKSAAAAAV